MSLLHKVGWARAPEQRGRETGVPWGPPWAPGWRGAGWRGRWRWWQVSGWRVLAAAWTGLLAASAAAPDAPAPASAHAWAAVVAGFVRSCWRSLREAWKRQDARNCCGKTKRKIAQLPQAGSRLRRSQLAEFTPERGAGWVRIRCTTRGGTRSRPTSGT